MNLFNIEAEQGILGTIILNNEYLRRVEDILEVKHFAEEAHKMIFEKILESKKEELVANTVTLKQFFDANFMNLEGSKYLSTLLAEASAIIDIRDYALVIIDLWRKRQLADVINQIDFGTESLNSAIDKIDGAIKEIDSDLQTIQVFDGEESIIDWAQQVEKKETLTPIPTNLKTLDEMLNGGFHKEGLYVFAAASGCGKTFFSQNIILNALKLNLGIFFVSMEMPKKKIMARFLSILSKINAFRVYIGNIFEWEQEKFNYALKDWERKQKKFFIVEKVSLSPKEIESALKKVLRKSPVDLLVVDYAQIMKLREARNFNEASLIKENVNSLAKLAQKYKMAVILLSQLTKDKISGKVGLGSLKGSGGLYEDADCVIAMWQDEEKSKEKIKNLQMEVLKNRDGMSGGLSLQFNGDIGEFKEINF